jgi:membrane-associated phospholipid phosphatase
MSWSAPIKLSPFRADLAVAHACQRMANPAIEQPLRVITWLADEKVLLAAGTVFWAVTRFSPSRPLRREADQMLCSLLIAGLVPHLGKYLVRRERPNRTVVRRHDTQVPRLGNAWDSFPSGHAVHLSAIAPSLRRLAPRRWRALLTGGLGALAATRIMLLAHYPSDVIAGWGIGALINKTVGAAFRKSERAAATNKGATPPLQPY